MMLKEAMRDVAVGALAMGVVGGLTVGGALAIHHGHWWGWILVAPFIVGLLGATGAAVRGGL